jgi:hypothetical protein
MTQPQQRDPSRLGNTRGDPGTGSRNNRGIDAGCIASSLADRLAQDVLSESDGQRMAAMKPIATDAGRELEVEP